MNDDTFAKNRVTRIDAGSTAFRAAIGATVALAIVFGIALAVPLDHLEGKAMGFRAPFFLASALVVPLAWRRRFTPYPATAAALVVTPFLLDTLGNLVGAYEAFDVTDDVLHTLNWVLLVLAFHAWRFRRRTSAVDARLLGVGVGALAIVGWEIAEWLVMVSGAGGELHLTYDDTVGDLLLSTTGGTIGSVLGVRWFGPAR